MKIKENLTKQHKDNLHLVVGILRIFSKWNGRAEGGAGEESLEMVIKPRTRK